MRALRVRYARDGSGESVGSDESGVVGFEVLPFLVLVFMLGALVFAQAWAVLDAKMATTAAVREAARTFVEQPGSAGASAANGRAIRAGNEALRAHNLAGSGEVSARGSVSLKRCSVARFEATHRVPVLRLPLRSSSDPITVRSEHSEIVDPFRSGLSGRASCAL